jgi:cytosine/adenosine deaminase-related metal-dependent hydrolase
MIIGFFIKMSCIAGPMLFADGFHMGYITFDINNSPMFHDGIPQEKPLQEGIIIPPFVNAHTHLGDSFIRKLPIQLPKDIKSLVGPPNGIKHQLLRSTDQETIKQGMHDEIVNMKKSGIGVFFDFRENGFAGAKLLKEAAKNTHVTPHIFGRPNHLRFDEEELLSLFSVVDGIGLSSVSDWDETELEAIVRLAQVNHIPISFHASESKREDIEEILSYKPSFLVHMTSASKDDFKRVVEQEVPIVVCPRSNTYFGLTPQLKLMKELNVELLIGTDNAMLHSPYVHEEIYNIMHSFPGVFSLEELLCMTTYRARKALNLEDGIPGANFPSSFVVLDPESLQVISLHA